MSQWKVNVIIILLICLFECDHVWSDSSLLCTNEFCENYVDEIGCPKVSDACRAQNSTFNGMKLPSATPCNCCYACLEYLKIGDFCTLGAPGAPVPATICGPHLICTKGVLNDEHATCQPMTETPCLKSQAAFDAARDKGTIGNLMQRPRCDGSGDYERIKCVPGQLCFCVAKNGERIFGEAIHTAGIETLMRCECSRMEATIAAVVPGHLPPVGIHCDSQGSFDVLQCVEDVCHCVNVNTGAPTTASRNITKGLSPFRCFDELKHDNLTFLRPCELEKIEALQNIADYESDDFHVITQLLNCQPDGWYPSVRETDSERFCADKYGNKLKKYSVPIHSDDAKDMNCNCARAETLMEINNSVELPKCCANGSYEKLACRRGECYCVNSDGEQISVEVAKHEMTTLACYNGGNFC